MKIRRNSKADIIGGHLLVNTTANKAYTFIQYPFGKSIIDDADNDILISNACFGRYFLGGIEK